MSYASQKRSSTHANFHAFRRPRRGSSSRDFSRPLPFLVWTNGMLLVSPLGVKIVYSGLYLSVFRTESQVFYTLRYRLGLWIQCVQYMSKSMILAVRRTHVKHKPCIWPSSPQVQCSSVVKASDRCTVGHIGSINVGDSDFFFVLCSWDVDHRSHFFAALHQETSIFKRGKYFSFTLGVK